MASIHTVKPGEHLSSIAEHYGFTKYETIWDHPDTAALKTLRKNPNVLNPGDQVTIPDRELRTVDRPVDARHRFTRSTPELKLRIVLDRMYNDPYRNTPCTLLVDSARTDLTTDSNAQVEHAITRSAGDGSLKVKDQIKAGGTVVPIEREVPFKIGHLDPVDEVAGQVARLANLGYYRGPDSPVDKEEFLSAVEEFQCENKLAVDGKCGPATQAKLLSVHGS
jgi:hypothetical protein